MVIRFALFCVMFALTSYGATYYIDLDSGDDANNGTSTSTPWLRAPGMQGFAATYSHSAGDHMVFKGGTTADVSVAQWTINNAGVDGTRDVYRSTNTWYAGASWQYPSIDAGTNYNGVICQLNGNYVEIRDFAFLNGGAPGSPNQGRAIKIESGDDILIQNCIIRTYNNHGIDVTVRGTGQDGPLSIVSNKFSHMSNSIELGHVNSGTNVLRDVTIAYNDFFDMTDMLVNGDHGDGIHFFSSGTNTAFVDVKIYGNQFYGDWHGADTNTVCAGQIHIEEQCKDVYIYNNVLSYNSTNSPFTASFMFSPGMMIIGRSDNVWIENNTFAGDNYYVANSQGAKSGVLLSTATNVVIRNNAFSHLSYGTLVYATGDVPGSTWTSDYNAYTNCWKIAHGSALSYGDGSLGDWQAAYGQDLNSVEGHFAFNDITAQPVGVAHQSLSSVLCDAAITSTNFGVDALQFSRPSGSAWDIGAYEFDQGDLWPNVPDSPPNRLWIGVP